MDQALYAATWQIQDVFRDPQHLGKPEHAQRLKTFQQNLDLVLNTFQKNPISHSVAAGHFATRDTGYHHCKYLTSQRLFTKQLHNPSFRRSILVQALIFLKSHNVDVPFQRPKLSPMNKFDAKDREWFEGKYAQILNRILPSIPPDGSRFAKFVKGVLERDEHWLIWKYQDDKSNRCSKLKRSPVITPKLKSGVVAVGSAPGSEPAMKRRRLNGNRRKNIRSTSASVVYMEEDAFLQRHLRCNRKATVMGDGNLKNTFQWMPAMYRSKRNVERHWRDEIKGEDKGLKWLETDYEVEDFEDLFKRRMEALVEAMEEVKYSLILLFTLKI